MKKCTQEEFYKGIKALLNKISVELEDKEKILEEINNNTFLPLQVCKDNSVIPYQVNKIELEAILNIAKKYYPIFNEVDVDCGKTISEKIIALFEFRIPYYVGPLNTAKGENAWMVRKAGAEGSIRPWNFEQMVDIDKAAADFIERMTNQCTYLTNETVLPKFSLLYSEYMVLNELNNVRIRGEKISVELKNNIYENLFKVHKQVTGKKLLEYLNSMGYDLQKEDLSGFDGNFKASLSSYITLKKEILGEEINKYSVQQMAEDIILWVTLYADAPNILKRVLKKNYSEKLTAEQIKKICRLRFKGWGRLSRAFLQQLEGENRDTKERLTIIKGLRESQNNLMQLLSEKYSFREEIDKANSGYKITDEITYDNVVKDIVASPSIKRAVWQTIQLVEEIKKVMGCEPKRIFVEMARGEDEKKERTVSRKDRLLKLYEAIKDETAKGFYDEIFGQEENKFKNIKLYLYYTQMGKCMYTGKDIDLSQLKDTTIWDKDHIYPRSKTKDDSLDNLVLVDKRINQSKDDNIIPAEIRKKMYGFWKGLRERGLISEEKFSRLIRTTPLSDEELAGFINRQLVEARQSSKIIATLFNRIYENTEIVYVKAKTVSDFRRDKCKYGIKVRDLNDYHHAKDAYLNIVVGNVYYNKFTNNPLYWLKNNKNAKYSLNCMFDYDIEKSGDIIWRAGENGTLETVNKYLSRNDILFTRYAYCNKGILFKVTPKRASKDSDKGKKLVPRKAGLDTNKYGGYNSVTPAYFMLVESKDKKGNLIRTIETVPLYRVKDFEKDEKALLDYCKSFYGLVEPKIIMPKIKKNSLIVVDGFPMHLKSSTGVQLSLQVAVQLCVDYKYAQYIKKLMKYIQANAQRKDKKELLKIDEYMGLTKSQNIELFDLMLNKLENSIYKLRPANPYKKLVEKQEVFESLSIEKQCVVLSEMLNLFKCKPLKANLTFVECSANAGTVKIDKNISNRKSVKLVNQSPTGIFEYSVDLLKI